MKLYNYNDSDIADVEFYEYESECHKLLKEGKGHDAVDADGAIITSSEWTHYSKDTAKRICAARTFFSEWSPEQIIEQAKERFPRLFEGFKGW